MFLKYTLFPVRWLPETLTHISIFPIPFVADRKPRRIVCVESSLYYLAFSRSFGYYYGENWQIVIEPYTAPIRDFRYIEFFFFSLSLLLFISSILYLSPWAATIRFITRIPANRIEIRSLRVCSRKLKRTGLMELLIFTSPPRDHFFLRLFPTGCQRIIRFT